MAPKRHFSHQDLAHITSQFNADLTSAGFFSARYSPTDTWEPYGKSVGLNLSSAPLRAPSQLWVGQFSAGLLFSDNPRLLDRCTNVVEATWGMSEEGWEGTCAVYSPLHPDVRLTAEEILRD